MRWGRLSAPNYRGVGLPLSLGAMTALAGVAGSVALATFRHVETGGWRVVGGSLLVFAAGVVDDLSPVGPRGLRGHLKALVRLRVTTGILKVFVIAAVSLVVVVSLPRRRLWVEIAGIAAIAACANLWNGLDVRPGRALKAFLPVAVSALVFGISLRLMPTLPGVLMAAAVALPIDLKERAMLGDGGSNLLGFTAGLCLYLVLPSWAVVVVAVLGVALNVAAETVSLSLVIERTTPLAWIDQLGRLREG